MNFIFDWKEEIFKRAKLILQIVYVSTIGKELIHSKEIDTILIKSRANNTRNNISGILLFRNGIFIQLLEGPIEIVDKTYEKIQKDPRHIQVTELARIYGGARIFSSWDMAYKEVDDSCDLKIINEIFSWNSKISQTHKISNQQIIKMLSSFREQIDGKIITDNQDE